MALTNPTFLTNSTTFRPSHHRAHSRSPSRSPIRKAQFTAQHLDPLLSNLSPDSTLKALQETETIPGGPTQDALSQSIADASPLERETGIRAALAAQKVRQWRNELRQWQWPSRRERGLGLGFLPPDARTKMESSAWDSHYLGYLPVKLVDEYEQRIDEIRDGLEALDIEGIKDHVLIAHVPARRIPEAVADQPKPKATRTGYGRLRDFTALITATVIQALPDLANLNLLLESWDIRLQVLRQLPVMLDMLESTKAGIQAAFETIHDREKSHLITQSEVDTTQALLGYNVSDLGSRMDRLLDMLEGHEDALPQVWIDALEQVELDYAAWVVEGQQIAMQNVLAGRKQQVSTAAHTEPFDFQLPGPLPESDLPPTNDHPAVVRPELSPGRKEVVAVSEQPLEFPWTATEPNRSLSQPKPSLKLTLPNEQGHRRERSEVSVADSSYSAFSDMSNAEIVDARSTMVMASPKVSVVDNPFRSSRDDLSWFGNSENPAAKEDRPPMLQRASTASIEIVPKDHVKRLDLRRSLSHDLLMQSSHSPDSTPAKALRQLTGGDEPGRTPMAELEDPASALQLRPFLADQGGPPSPSLIVQPLQVRSRSPEQHSPVSPTLPRRSSKRISFGSTTMLSPISPNDAPKPFTVPAANHSIQTSSTQNRQPKKLQKTRKQTAESLEEKIQDILTTLPTKIRLTNEPDASSSNTSSNPASRSTTPTPGLTLSPAKHEQSDRSGNSANDVRLFHLTRSGQSRDTPPVKLFVRTVGENGERVMVRVGGGWADLGEYLREYSAHHGGHSLADDRFEVANFPNGQVQANPGSSPAISTNSSRTTMGLQSQKNARSLSSSQSASNLVFGSDMSAQKSRRSQSPEPVLIGPDRTEPWHPPPVPVIPSSFTMQSPTMTSSTGPEGIETSMIEHDREPPALPQAQDTDTRTPSTARSTTMLAPGIITTTTITAPPSTNSTKYTPLGAAGPVSNGRRAVTYGGAPAAENEAWVQDMVGKARAVSGGGTTTVIQGPTTTTTTMVTSTAPRMTSAVPRMTPAAPRVTSVAPSTSRVTSVAPSTSRVTSVTPSTSGVSSMSSATPSRRASAMPLQNSSPTISSMTPSPSSSFSGKGHSLSGPRSRMSLSDMSGIRRVFLRKKTEK